jgi:hypothetical protein
VGILIWRGARLAYNRSNWSNGFNNRLGTSWGRSTALVILFRHWNKVCVWPAPADLDLRQHAFIDQMTMETRMTIREQINSLLNLATAPEVPPDAKRDAIAQARNLCREHKIGMGSFEWPHEPTGDDGIPEQPAVSEPIAETTADQSIGQMVERLLLDPTLNFVEIARRVRDHFPHARTTNRSVASTAKAMRSRGDNVMLRRRPNRSSGDKGTA